MNVISKRSAGSYQHASFPSPEPSSDTRSSGFECLAHTPSTRCEALALRKEGLAFGNRLLSSFSVMDQNGTSSPSFGASSLLAAGEPGGGVRGAAGALDDSRFADSNWKFSITTASLLRFWPVCLSSHDSVCSRPETSSGSPFFTYCPIVSADLPKAVQSTNEQSSFCSPLSVFHLRLMASVTFTTAVPFGVNRSSGSRVTFPTRVTELNDGMDYCR
jgi:hypothetical protein